MFPMKVEGDRLLIAVDGDKVSLGSPKNGRSYPNNNRTNVEKVCVRVKQLSYILNLQNTSKPHGNPGTYQRRGHSGPVHYCRGTQAQRAQAHAVQL